MGKTWLIIRTEYKNRVTKKSFLLLTLLMPILFAAIILVPMWLATFENDIEKRIAVIDYSGLYENCFLSNDDYNFELVYAPLEQIRNTEQQIYYQAFIVISGDLSIEENRVTIYSEQYIDYDLKQLVQNRLENHIRREKLRATNIPNIETIIENAEIDVPITTIKWDDNGNEAISSTNIATIVGIVAMMVVYMFVFFYSVMVLNSVVQEKINRVVEVMVCSVKPIELMIGKIVSMALVGLTQFAIWIVLTIAILFIHRYLPEHAANSGTAIFNIKEALLAINWIEMCTCFLAYFVGGFLLYASIYAAIGAIVDNETDTQQFTLPVTIPLLFAIYAAIYGVQNPDGPLTFWCSMIPFTSPIVMMVRLPFDVPVWQILLSLAILAITFVSTSWIAAKVYRANILMYGKRATWKTLWQVVKAAVRKM